MNDSVCFSATPVETLNLKAYQLDRRLFLFAYYAPTPFFLEESPRAKFITAILNLYGLLWDCGPFVRNILMKSWKECPLENILPDWDWEKKKSLVFRFRNLSEVVSAFRSIFCHNNSAEFALNREAVEKAHRWNVGNCRIYSSLDELRREDWQIMLEQLISEADQVVRDLDTCLEELRRCLDTARFNTARETWLQAIASTYLRNPDLLLNAMVDFYQLYLYNTNGNLKNNSLRNQTIRWLATNFDVDEKTWYMSWLDDGKDLKTSKVYILLENWQSCWATWNPSKANEPCDPPLPASDFFLILASDVYHFAQHPTIDMRS